MKLLPNPKRVFIAGIFLLIVLFTVIANGFKSGEVDSWIRQIQNSVNSKQKANSQADQESDKNAEKEELNQNESNSEPSGIITDSVVENPSESTQPTPPTQTGNWWDYPAEIITITSDPNDLNVVVSKKYKLPSTYAPTDLVQITGTSARETKTLYLRSVALEALKNLTAAAASAGIDLSIQSAYRSYQTQVSTYQYWVDYNGGNAALADQVSARPGHSEHQLGTVVDFSTASAGDQVSSAFNGTPACEWLAVHAGEYGFVLSYPQGQEWATGYAYEGWHYRFKGK